MANLVPFNIDLTAHEGTRLAAVLEAIGPHWDPTQVFADEAQAHRMLYTDFDPDSGSWSAPGTVGDAVFRRMRAIIAAFIGETQRQLDDFTKSRGSASAAPL